MSHLRILLLALEENVLHPICATKPTFASKFAACYCKVWMKLIAKILINIRFITTMIFDNPSSIEQNNYDILIIGSGPAGTMLAQKLLNKKQRVLVLEAGKNNWEEISQEIYKGSTSGFGHADLEDYRMRQLGGSSNCWGGACVPYDSSDFEISQNGKSLWPIKKSDLVDHYIAAAKFCGIGNYFSVSNPPNVFRKKIPRLSQKYWLVNDEKKNFTGRYDIFKSRSSNIDLCLNSNVFDVVFDENNLINKVIISDYDNETTQLIANKVVLCTGGLESTRLILNWAAKYRQFNSIKRNLGRFYSPHINTHTGQLITFANEVENADYIKINNQVRSRGFFSLDFKRSEQDIFLNSKWTLDKISSNSTFFNDYFSQNSGLIKYLSFDGKKADVWNMKVAFDQTPTSESRVSLLEEKDRFGLNRINLHYHIDTIDFSKIENTYLKVAQIFGQFGIGRMNIGNVENFLNSEEIGRSHHTGTLRMSETAELGCVDQNLKVHGVQNLWICSSAIFPTPSHANPTFTIMAFANRLAEELIV
jgi:hypothetical protein